MGRQAEFMTCSSTEHLRDGRRGTVGAFGRACGVTDWSVGWRCDHCQVECCMEAKPVVEQGHRVELAVAESSWSAQALPVVSMFMGLTTRPRAGAVRPPSGLLSCCLFGAAGVTHAVCGLMPLLQSKPRKLLAATAGRNVNLH